MRIKPAECLFSAANALRSFFFLQRRITPTLAYFGAKLGAQHFSLIDGGKWLCRVHTKDSVPQPLTKEGKQDWDENTAALIARRLKGAIDISGRVGINGIALSKSCFQLFPHPRFPLLGIPTIKETKIKCRIVSPKRAMACFWPLHVFGLSFFRSLSITLSSSLHSGPYLFHKSNALFGSSTKVIDSLSALHFAFDRNTPMPRILQYFESKRKASAT